MSFSECATRAVYVDRRDGDRCMGAGEPRCRADSVAQTLSGGPTGPEGCAVHHLFGFGIFAWLRFTLSLRGCVVLTAQRSVEKRSMKNSREIPASKVHET